jgi:Zn-finger nucleic acid-binding protein
VPRLPGRLAGSWRAGKADGRATAPVAPAPQAYAPPPQPQPYAQPPAQPWGGGASQPYRGDDRGYRGDKYRDDRHRDDDYRYKKKKRDSIFDIFD